MKIILEILAFHIFYHISYFVTFDVWKYCKGKNINFLKEYRREILYLIGMPFLIFLMGSFFLEKMESPLIGNILFFFLLGPLITRDLWILYTEKMKNYEDFYFSKYYKSDYLFMKRYITECPTISHFLISNQKIRKITEFMSDYPYPLVIKKSKLMNAYADLERKEIILTEGALSLPIEEVKAMLGHELIHFEVDGKMSLHKRKILFFISLYVILAFLLLIIFFFRHANSLVKLILIFLFLFFLCYFIFYSGVMPERYLYQFSELKCDRLACTLNGVSREGMISLLKRGKVSKRKKEKWYLKMARRYFLFDDHPNISFRIKLIENYRKWSILDYILLPTHLIKQLILGKGWNDD